MNKALREAINACLPVFSCRVYRERRGTQKVVIEDRFGRCQRHHSSIIYMRKRARRHSSLHGYAENSHMWRPLMAELAKTHTVVAPDLRGFGQSSRPAGGYDKKTMAQDVHALAVLARLQAGTDRWPRYRTDGRLRLRRAISD